jgi:murein DD-endopeptidase MepM/ murein hydrolase activator NlpD
MRISNLLSYIIGFYAVACLISCKSGPFNLIKPATPHEQYAKKLENAGLNKSVMGTAWLNTAAQSIQKALSITLPYQEKGYFAADKVEAAAFKFRLNHGQKLNIQLTKKPNSNFLIYLDIWEYNENNTLKLVAAADTLNNAIVVDADKTGDYILRLQPELLGSGEYALMISTGPSLGLPLKSMKRSQIQSYYGDGRDKNTRKHEGIDIFAPFRTPVVAVSSGVVTGVNHNNLGGKVVWFRPEGKAYTLYYAHLDEQTVSAGQAVMQGDTLGLMGNTGNAKTTAPHLHFGIYTPNGAVDPLPFIDPLQREIPKISSSLAMLNTNMRTTGQVSVTGNVLGKGNIVRVAAASGNDYRVVLPNGNTGYINSRSLSSVKKPLSSYQIKMAQEVFDRPTDSAAVNRA